MSTTNMFAYGRFSSQMLSAFGAQKVTTTSGSKKYRYSTPGSTMTRSSTGVVGSYSGENYNITRSFYTSRGASIPYADVMSGLSIDAATIMNISAQTFLENSETNRKFDLSTLAYNVSNLLRDPGAQLTSATQVNNKKSLQSREILP